MMDRRVVPHVDEAAQQPSYGLLVSFGAPRPQQSWSPAACSPNTTDRWPQSTAFHSTPGTCPALSSQSL